MQTRKLSTGATDTYVAVFDAGDEAVDGLTSFAREAGLDAAQLTAVGGFERATVGWFDLEARDYRRIEVDEQVELLSARRRRHQGRRAGR